MSTVPKELCLTKPKIEGMYKMIRFANDGEPISPESLYKVLGCGGEVELEEFIHIIKKVDKHERGHIDIHEFKLLIEHILEK